MHSRTVFSLICLVAGNPLPVVSFYKDYTILKNNSRTKITFQVLSNKTIKASMKIYSPSKKDTGTYACCGSNTFYNGSSFESKETERVVIINIIGSKQNKYILLYNLLFNNACMHT